MMVSSSVVVFSELRISGLRVSRLFMVLGVCVGSVFV